MDNPKQNRYRTGLTLALFALVLTYGISFTMVGPLMPEVLSVFNLNLAEGGGVVSIQNVAGLLAVILCGIYGDRWNKWVFIGIGALVFVVTLMLVGSSSGYGFLLTVFFFLGMGTRGFDTLSNAVISDLHGAKRSLYLNLLHTAFGVGAFLGPIVVFSLGAAGVSWSGLFSILGIAAAVALAAYTAVVIRSRGLSGSAVTDASADYGLFRMFGRSRIWILGAVIFLHMGVLGTMITWLPLYADGLGGSGPFLSRFTLSALWMGIIFSRLLVSRLAGRLGELRMIRWGSLVPLLVLIPAILAESAWPMAVAIVLFGLFIGFTIPFVVSVGCGWYPVESASVSSVLFIFGYLSIVVYPWVSGVLGDLFGLMSAMILVAASQIVLFAVSWLFPSPDRNVVLK